MIELELPYVPQSAGDGPQCRFSAVRSTPHKGSKSKSSQATTTKDNSAAHNDEGFSAADGSNAGRDNALVIERHGKGGGVEVVQNTLDAGAIEGALDFAGGAGEAVVNIIEDALDFAANSDSRTANTINAATTGVRQLSEKVIDDLTADRADARSGAENEILNTLGKYSTAIVIAGAAGLYFYSRKKSA